MFLKIQTKDKSGNTLNKLVNELLATICKIFMNLAFDFKFYIGLFLGSLQGTQTSFHLVI